MLHERGHCRPASFLLQLFPERALWMGCWEQFPRYWALEKSGVKVWTWPSGSAGPGDWNVLFLLNDLSRCSGRSRDVHLLLWSNSFSSRRPKWTFLMIGELFEPLFFFTPPLIFHGPQHEAQNPYPCSVCLGNLRFSPVVRYWVRWHCLRRSACSLLCSAFFLVMLFPSFDIQLPSPISGSFPHS